MTPPEFRDVRLRLAMPRALCAASLITAAAWGRVPVGGAAAGAGPAAPEQARSPIVTVDRDNVVIDRECIVKIAPGPIIDADNNGVVHIRNPTGSLLVIDLDGQILTGAATPGDRNGPGESTAATPDQFTGTGIRIIGGNITLRNVGVRGYKCGIHASDAAGLVIEDVDVSGNFRQRLKSTPAAEEGSDWLWPHRNDGNEWLVNYGAGLYVENSAGVTIRRVRCGGDAESAGARRRVSSADAWSGGQNGIILDRVNDSRIYDNDCSFLSGWGLAMWRSSRNEITRNALDFCVRGYSHGVYNRGQDSAGLLMFEQCSENLIAENSITHGGDGIFAFGGREALGEAPPPGDSASGDQRLGWHRGRGCNGNRILNNDLSCAVAHGLELTFSFDNVIHGNRMAGNGICGIWGGYSSRLEIRGNTFEANGEMAYGLERGGINIEHGCDNVIAGNVFRANACGVHLWWDEDEGLLKLPWAKVNDVSAARNLVVDNRFEGDSTALHLRQARQTGLAANLFIDVATPLEADEASRASLPREFDVQLPPPPELAYTALGEARPVGARQELRGREHIIITEWGPYDWQAPLLQRVENDGRRHVYRLAGPQPIRALAAEGQVIAMQEGTSGYFSVIAAEESPVDVLPYRVRVMTPMQTLVAEGVLQDFQWTVRVFPSAADPRTDAARWRSEGERTGAGFAVRRLDLRFGHGGPGDLEIDPLLAQAGLPRDHFGTIAVGSARLPAGRWRIRTISDDGLRVRLDDRVVIDDWTHHGPTEHHHEFALDVPRRVALVVEHFELDGFAVLAVEVDRVE